MTQGIWGYCQSMNKVIDDRIWIIHIESEGRMGLKVPRKRGRQCTYKVKDVVSWGLNVSRSDQL